AIAYHELRTGALPFTGNSAQQLMLVRHTRPPDLQRLPPEERAAVARALSKEPQERFGCCKDFVRALRNSRRTPAPDTPTPRPATRSSPLARTLPALPSQRMLEERIARVVGLA